MKIGFTVTPEAGDAGLLFADIAGALTARGERVCGLVQIDSRRPGHRRCDMDVKILPRGPVIRISQTLGGGAGACRLDAGALETAVALVGASLQDGTDVVILNKFGKQEAAGRGFRDLIAEAASRRIPVLLSVNRLNMAAFEEFTAGLATRLAPHAGDILRWLDGARPDSAGAGQGQPAAAGSWCETDPRALAARLQAADR